MAKFEALKENSGLQDVITKVNKHSIVLNKVEDDNLNIYKFIDSHNNQEEIARRNQTDELKDFIKDQNEDLESKVFSRLKKVEAEVKELKEADGKEAIRLRDKIKNRVEDKIIEIIIIALIAYFILVKK